MGSKRIAQRVEKEARLRGGRHNEYDHINRSRTDGISTYLSII